MSQENIEIVRRFVEGFRHAGEPVWAEIDPDVEFVVDPGSLLAGTYRGHEGIRDLLRLTNEVFDDFRYEVDEMVDAGDAVLVLGRLSARGVQSGATGRQSGAVVLWMRDGRIVAYRSYFDRREAFAAIGRPEQD